MKYTMSIALAVLAFAAPLAANDLKIELDTEQTSIVLRLQATLHSVHGTAAAVSGSMHLDIESGEATGEVIIAATSAQTGNTQRDKKMHTKVLRSAEHPWIVLRPRRLEGSVARPGTSNVTLHGQMEILGQSHGIAIPLHIEIDNERFTADAAFEVPYVEWGLEDPSTFMLRVAKVVEIQVKAVGSVGISDQPN